jgi:membrane-associated phospholipid phosphatase
MSGAIDGATPYTSESLLQLSLNDQKAMWTSPFHLRPEDERPLVLWATGMFALTATDSKVMRHVGNTPVAHANGFSNYGVAALTATATSFYLSGTVRNDLHSRETGFLAGEAATNGVIVAEAMKFVFGRARPDERDAGSFRAGGASFPSEHAVAAWSIASVIAQEYPGPLTKLVAYGTASGISVARVAARQHFPSDVVVGSAVGYLIGHYVYRTHHDPELPGVSFGNSEKDFNEKTSRPRSPSEFASPSVPLDSWIYAAFDRLTALGYAPSAYANLRPWTRMECARIIAAARDELHIADVMEDSRANILWIDGTGGYVPPMKAPSIQRRSEAYGLYKALAAEFANDLERHDGSNSSEIRLDSLYTRYLGIAGTPLDDGYHFGQTLLNDFGRLYGAGPNVVSGASAWGSKGSVAFYVRGEYQHAAALTPYSQPVQQMIGNIDVTPPQDPIHTNVVDRFRLLDAYVAWNFKTLQISAGRQSLWWGPGAGGPTNMSDNAEPLDMVRVTNPSPWRLPGLLHWLGPVRWDTFFGLMAGHRYPALPAIDGQKISFKPTQNLEFGFSRTVLFRPITARMFSRGFFSFGDNPTTTPGSRTDVGDRRSGFDFSYRIPGLRNWLVLYNDGMADDETSPLAYPQMSLMNPGIYLPQIPGVQKLDFRAEMAWSDPPALSNRAGKYVYYNGAYHDAYTNDGHLFGSWVGREGHGLQLWGTYWFNPRNSVQAGYRKAHVDRDFIPSGGGIRDFFIRTAFQLRPGMEIGTFLQYEQWSFPVLSPLSGPNTVASIEFTYRPELRKELNVR